MESQREQAPSFLNVGKSLKDSRWVFPSIEQDVVARIAQQHSLPEYVARMLHIRGVGPDDVESFLYPTLRAHFPDPFSMAGMKPFAEDAAQKIMNHETIGILADFDVDGSTSAAILTRFLRHCGMMPPLYIPCRLNEGYGPNINAVQTLHKDGAQMIIMADCGTTSFEAVTAARNLGMDVAIFDHHEQEATLPDANHVINPKRNDDTSGLNMLAACGVTFLACVAINTVLKREKFYEKAGINEPNMKQWIDLVGLGTICDMVPMTGPNRLLVRAGFHQMSLKTNMGIRALCEVGNLANAPTFTDAGFVIGPRINAGSRVHKSDLGAKLLSTDNIDEARSIAYVLDDCNEQRKSIQSKMMKEAIEKVEKEGLDQHSVIIVGDDGWHPGLSGLVAGRLKERYGKPAICVTYAQNQEGVLEGRGSGRSIPGVNLAQCFIEARNQELLVKGGGHAMAGGFTVMPDRLPEFRAFLSKSITAQMEHMDLTQETVIDGIASIRGAQSQFVRLVTDHIGPFGPQNIEPVFALANVRVQTVDILKDKHIRVQMSDWEGGPRMKAMFFYGIGTKLGETLLNHGQRLMHFAGQFQINNWQGRESVEFLISDAAVASEHQQSAA